MATVKIIDTGYLTKARSGSTVTRVNSGTAIAVDASSLSIMDKASLEAEPQVARTDAVDTNYISAENRKYRLSIRLDRGVSADRTVMKHLFGEQYNSSYPGITRTKGLKLIYMDGSSTNKLSIIEIHGGTNTNFHGNEIGASAPAILGRFTGCTTRETPGKSMVVIDLEFTEG